jgi:hypothetical protein
MGDDMIYTHFSLAPWDSDRWPNFHPSEKNLHCPCCGEFYLDPVALDALQALRRRLGQPVKVNSGHRCRFHNARVGGAPRSMHKRVAFDVSLSGHRLRNLIDTARGVGFQGFGFYSTFLHLDMGRRRYWITNGGKKRWNGLPVY